MRCLKQRQYHQIEEEQVEQQKYNNECKEATNMQD